MAMESFLSNELYVEVIDDGCEAAVGNKISTLAAEGYCDAFFIGDLGDIVYKHQVWLSELPRVEPFYAVNCNDNPAVLSVLAKLGTGFACANKAEMQKVSNLQVRPSRIVYSNPCKQSSHIQWAARHGVDLTTFDSEMELHKIKAKHPSAKLIMRIGGVDGCDGNEQESGMQFGCRVKQVAQLLATAKQLDLDIVGISFHIGRNCIDASTYSDAVVTARAIFDLAAVEGFHFRLLDIGGGFPGHKSTGLSFQEIAAALRPALDQYFPADDDVRIVAESGRYFVSSAFTLAVNIVARRTVDSLTDDNNDSADSMNIYYVNEGVYGSFNCLLSGQEAVQPSLVDADRFVDEPHHVSSVFGPTLDELDCIIPRCMLPRLESGDWLMFADMGAYTINEAAYLARSWAPECHYIIKEHLWAHLQQTDDDSLHRLSASSCCPFAPCER